MNNPREIKIGTATYRLVEEPTSDTPQWPFGAPVKINTLGDLEARYIGPKEDEGTYVYYNNDVSPAFGYELTLDPLRKNVVTPTWSNPDGLMVEIIPEGTPMEFCDSDKWGSYKFQGLAESEELGFWAGHVQWKRIRVPRK